MPQSGFNLLLPLPIFQTQLAPKLPVRPPSFFPYTSASSLPPRDAIIMTTANTLGSVNTYPTQMHNIIPYPALPDTLNNH